MPANILLDDLPVQSELNRYLPDNWPPVIERDIDGPNSLPTQIDGDVPNLGRYGACRRVARSIFLGSAPIQTAANQGLEDRRIKLGCVNPGEPPAIFGDAMRRLANTAAYLYQDGARYWYSTQPTVATLAEGRAEEYRRNRDPVDKQIEARLRADLSNRGDFKAVHVLPASGQDVQDDHDAPPGGTRTQLSSYQGAECGQQGGDGSESYLGVPRFNSPFVQKRARVFGAGPSTTPGPGGRSKALPGMAINP